METSLTARQLADLLTMAGFEVEEVKDEPGAEVLDVKVVSNRGDALSALGLAREVLAKDPDARPTELFSKVSEGYVLGDEDASDVCSHAQVEIQTDDCGRYACRVLRGVTNGEAPAWMRERLALAGMRPISLLVDVSNYVLLELGQPLHTFDLDQLEGARIIVRKAKEGERLTTLDGIERELDPAMMMICDAARPVAAAGIMGGLDSEVSERTRNVLLESASFLNTSVRWTRKRLGLSTEASYRFERSVDPELVVTALNRFADLLREATGEQAAVPGVLDVRTAPVVARSLTVRMARARTLLGMEVGLDEARRYLERLGMGVVVEGDSLVVAIPTWRPDLQREDDLIEEIGRIHGYEKIPELLPEGSTPQGGVFGVARALDEVRGAAVRAGLVQIMSHTLRDRHPLDFRDDERVVIRNPHSPEMALLRNSVLPGLSDAALRNGARDLHLFEVGRVFVGSHGTYDESPELGILSIGELDPPHWSGDKPPSADFYSLKTAVEEIARAIGACLTWAPPRLPDPRFHPTIQSGVLVDEGRLWVGTVGQIHPDVADEVGLPHGTQLAELDLLVLIGDQRPRRRFHPISRNPAVRRDIAVELDKTVPYEEVQRTVRQCAGDVLEDTWLFDVYEGPGIPEGRRSLAIALQLRKFGENFTDEEANQVRDRVVEGLARLGAKLR